MGWGALIAGRALNRGGGGGGGGGDAYSVFLSMNSTLFWLNLHMKKKDKKKHYNIINITSTLMVFLY